MSLQCRRAASSTHSLSMPRPRRSSRNGSVTSPTPHPRSRKLELCWRPQVIQTASVGWITWSRDIAIFKLWSQAIQAMLKEALNVQCNLRTVVESIWFDDAASGHFDLAIGAVVGTLLDPSDSFNAWYGKDGPQNYSFWDNTEFQALTARIDREIDPAKRLALVHQAEAIMEQDPPLLPVAWERINEVWYNYVKGLNPAAYFGIFDVVRLDTVWLDKG